MGKVSEYLVSMQIQNIQFWKNFEALDSTGDLIPSQHQNLAGEGA